MANFLKQMLINKFLLVFYFIVFAGMTAFSSEKILRIGIQEKLIPLEYIDNEGRPQGLIVELWKLWSEKVQHPVLFVPITKSNTITALMTGEVDIINNNLYLSQENLDRLLQTNPLYELDYFVFTHKNSKDLGELGDLEKYKIGVNETDFIKEWSKYGLPDSMIIRYKDTMDLYRGLMTGEVQHGITSDTLFRVALAKDNAAIKIYQSSVPLFSYPLQAWVSTDNFQLQTLVNSGLKKITSQEINQISTRWIGRSYGHQIRWELFSIGMLLLISLFIGIAMWFWNYNLKEKINIATKGLLTQHNQLKASEKELGHLRNYLSNIFDSMPSILIGVNAEGKVTQWNKMAQDYTGVSADNALGEILGKVFPEMQSKMGTIAENIQTKKINKEFNIIHQTEDVVLYQNLTIYPLISSGIEGAVIRIDDVTKEHELEAQLSQSHKMDAIGQLAAGVAHDFNNMLSGIMGAAQILKLSKINLDRKGLDLVDLILQASGQAADLTAKLLAFGRKGKGNVMSTPITIDGIIDDTVGILNRTIDKKIKISVKKKALLNTVMGDHSALQSALMNLSINSSHAMPNGGKIQILTKNIKLEKTYCDTSPFEIEPGDYVEIELRDTGIGIPLKNIKKVFDPFFTSKKHGEGTGLGLAAVYGTVQDHHGAISVYSEVGVGTVFYIYLPCTEELVDYKQTSTGIISGVGQILLVDDEEVIRITVKTLLEEMGYDVILAENGMEAVEVYKEQYEDIDLVIIDMIMPEMNGKEAFKKIKKINETCKVVIASGFIKDESLDELREEGFLDFIQKPYSSSELSQLLAKILTAKK